MNIKRISLRFNLDNKADRKPGEHLNNVSDSKYKAVITAINQFYEPHTETTEVIRKTIRECLQNLSVIQTESAQPTEALSEEENELMDSLDMFLGE